MLIEPGLRRGAAEVPRSKSHLHRLLIADFLAGDRRRLADDPDDSDDIKATKRCLRALDTDRTEVTLDCGESGSTLRFLAPVAAALGKRATFRKAGRLAARPAIEYPEIRSGLHVLGGDVSSQFATGLLFALPMLAGDSEIRFDSPLQSRGYVDMTLAVVRGAGVAVEATAAGGFLVPGGQRFRAQPEVEAERDWSGAAFWLAANAIGNEIAVAGMNPGSAQPDRAMVPALAQLGGEIDVSQFPDSFPALAMAAACNAGTTVFAGIRRLRLKESDRAAAMADVLARFGVKTEADENRFAVHGTAGALRGGAFGVFGDHRIAMAVAIGATRAAAAVEIDRPECVAKSYPRFFKEFAALRPCGGERRAGTAEGPEQELQP